MKQDVMKFTILGAGIGGLTTAIALQQKGFEVEVFEAAPQINPVGAALGLGANAIKVLQKLGIADAIIQEGKKLDAICFYTHKGTLLSHTDSNALSSKYGLDNFAIHRAALHEQLLAHCHCPVHLNKRATGHSINGETIILQFADGTMHNVQNLVVADGIHSAIRRQLLPGVQPRYAGYVCWRGVVNAPHINRTEASETLGPRGRFGITPIADNRIYWYACTNAPKNNKIYPAYTIDDLRKHFAGYHSPIQEILELTPNEQLIYGEIADLPPIHRFAFGNIVLLGDAAHATTPNMGQGACQAMEDAIVLADELGKNPNVPAAFKNYENRRMERVHYITRQSRRVGMVAQWQHPLLGLLRDALIKNIPQSTRMKQFDKLYSVDF